MSITIYGVTRSRASRPVWACLEAGLAFEQVPVIQARRLADPLAADAPLNTRSPAFLAVNAMGQIPSMKDGDLVLHESLAITLYLARKAGPPLGPQTLEEEGRVLMWSFWAGTEAEPAAIQILYNRADLPEAERDRALAEAAIERLRPKLAVLDSALEGSDWLLGERFTVADINVAEVLRYAMPAPEAFEATPHVRRWMAACHERPTFQELMRRREAEPA